MSGDAGGRHQALMAALEAGRARGTAVADPVGLAVIEALARRAAAQQGEALGLLLQRLDQLLAEHGALNAAAAATAMRAAMATQDPAPPRVALAGLGALVDRLGRTPLAGVPSGPPGSPGSESALRPMPPTSLKAVTAFKRTWSRLRAEQRLRQALAQVPAQAGPLNSSHLVHRALQSMHALSPAYLDAFMAHVDTLLWLEEASGAGDLIPRATRSEPGRRPGARAPRKT